MGNGTFALEDPVIEDVFDTLIVSDSVSIGIDDIISYYGLDNVEVSAGNPVTTMAADVSGNIHSKGFAIEAEVNDDNELEVTLTDNDPHTKYKLPVKQKLNKKCENFSIKWDVNNINVGAQVKYTLKNGLKYASVGVDIDSEISGKIGVEGNFSDGIFLCQTPAPIGNHLVAVNVALYIVPTIDGSITLKVEVPFHAGVSYEKGKGVNGTMGLRSSMQTSIEAEGKMGLYFRTAPMLVTMKSIPLLDAELDMGAEADAKRTGRPNGQICSDVNINFPVFKLGAGNESVKYKNKKSLLCTMNISKDCEFASFAKSKSLHYEILADGTKQFVDECTYNEQSENDKPKESEASTEAPTQEKTTQQTNENQTGSLHTYKTRMAEYFPEQTTFYFDYLDNWTVVSESVNEDTERVTIQNDNGVQIQYIARDDKFGTDFIGNIIVEAKNDVVSKPRYNSGGELVIVKTKDYKEYSRTSPDVREYDDGAERYALMPSSTHFSVCSTGNYRGCYFETPKETMFYSIPSKKLTDKDREEIIAILESFRDTP